MSVIMVVSFMPTMAFATGDTTPSKTWDDNGKFKVELQSGATTATAEVYDDYSVVAKVKGNTVDAASLKFSAAMKNVKSLNVSDERTYEKTFNTGLTQGSNIPLADRFPHIFGKNSDNINAFGGTTITGTVDNNPFGYTVSGFTKKDDVDEYELTATPTDEQAVRTAWHAITANVESTTGTDNSKIEIPKGAYLHVGNEILKFESACTVDPSSQNNGAGTVQAIKDAARLYTEQDTATTNVELYVPKDSVVQLSSSLAKLNRGMYVRSNIQMPENYSLDSLRTAANTGLAETVLNLINLVDGVVAYADDNEINVDILSAYSVTIDGTTKMYAYNDAIGNALPADKTWVIKGTNTVVTADTKVTSDMEIVEQTVTPGPAPSGGGALPPATDNVTNNAADKNTTADLTPAVKDNKAETTVDAKTADKIVEKALENKSEEIIVDAAGNNTVASSEVGIPEKTVKEIAEKTDAKLVIKTDNGKVDLDKAAVKAVADQAGTTGTVKLIVETVKNDADICHVNLKLVTSNGAVKDFKGGNVKVTINLTKELAAKDVVCVYINDNGIYTLVEGVLNADGTYTFTTGHFSEYAVMAKDEADKVIAEQLNTLIKEVNLKVRTSKTAKKNIKAVVSGDVKAITDAGYTVKYKFYRSEKKASKYEAKATKAGKTYINTKGKKGTKYYYKAKALVYDGDKLVGQTVLKQCKYGVRTWSK